MTADGWEYFISGDEKRIVIILFVVFTGNSGGGRIHNMNINDIVRSLHQSRP